MRSSPLTRRLRLEPLEPRALLSGVAGVDEIGCDLTQDEAPNAEVAAAAEESAAPSESNPAASEAPAEASAPRQVEYFAFPGRKPQRTAEGEVLGNFAEPERYLSPPIATPPTPANPPPTTTPVTSLPPATLPAIEARPSEPLPAVSLPPALPAVSPNPIALPADSNAVPADTISSNPIPPLNSVNSTNSTGGSALSPATNFDAGNSSNSELSPSADSSRSPLASGINRDSRPSDFGSVANPLAASSVLTTTSRRDAHEPLDASLGRSTDPISRGGQPATLAGNSERNGSSTSTHLKRLRAAKRPQDSLEFADWLGEIDPRSLERDEAERDIAVSARSPESDEFANERPDRSEPTVSQSIALRRDPADARAAVDAVWRDHARGPASLVAEAAAELLRHDENRQPGADRRIDEGGMIELPAASIARWQRAMPGTNHAPSPGSPIAGDAIAAAEIPIDADIGRHQEFEIAAGPEMARSRPVAARTESIEP